MEKQTVRFSDLKVGDKIIGSNGEPTEITQVYEEHIPVRMFELEMENGEKVEASGNHLWYCETTLDKKNKDEYIRLAKNFFDKGVEYAKLAEDPEYNLEIMITLFGDDIETQLYIENACRALGHSSFTPRIVDTADGKVATSVNNYSYNNLIDFLSEQKQALESDGYIYYGQVRTTEEIAELIYKGQDVNIPSIN